MTHIGRDTLKTKKTLTVDTQEYTYFCLNAAADHYPELRRLPYALKILVENILRFENGKTVTINDVAAFAEWTKNRTSNNEIAFQPARVLMQDFTGVPAIVDLAAMRQAMIDRGGDPKRINPLYPVDLVIDHSVMVDGYGDGAAFHLNVEKEYERNKERYAFLRWGQKAFDNFRVVPPGTGICHQVNLEYLAKTVWYGDINGETYAYPDTLVGTDSHTTMINGLGVLGWGVGGIEAEAAMLGQPISMVIPDVIGFKLTGHLPAGTTATDLVLTVTEILRKHGVVGKFVEFYGRGLDHLSLADRATIGNMAPEYGATCGIFPIDNETVRYLTLTGRPPHEIALVETYAKAQGLFRDSDTPDPVFTQTVHLDLGSVVPCLAGPKRPQDRIPLSSAKKSAETAIHEDKKATKTPIPVENFHMENGHVVIAAITSCTNTSNPSVMLGAGLLAQKANARGLKTKPWVKTSLAPGSKVVTDYLTAAGLTEPLNALGFNLVGYGCTTCIGNSGPLKPAIADAIDNHDLCVASVLSGNRNFEGRIHPQVKLSYLASPLLVVAYALTGTMNVDLTTDPIGNDPQGNPVYLADIWPSSAEINDAIAACVRPDMFRERYQSVFHGDELWRALGNADGVTYDFDVNSTYVKNPPYFQSKPDDKGVVIANILNARPLAILGDSITTDHISPAGSIKQNSPAGLYLLENGVDSGHFNSYGARRGNHDVMVRGTFANIRLKNEMVLGLSGGITRHMPNGTEMSIYDASVLYHKTQTPLIIIAGKEYGTGSSRDWAAKGTNLLGVKAVIAESFERIHRSNLVGMGILPLEFTDGDTRHTLNLGASDCFDLTGLDGAITPKMLAKLTIQRADGTSQIVSVKVRIDTVDELSYIQSGGILHYVLNTLTKNVA